MKTSFNKSLVVVLLIVCGYAQAADAQNLEAPQTPKVRGHIYGENNEKLPNIMVMLSEIGCLAPQCGYFAYADSQMDGSFEIDAISDSVLLRIEALGYFPVKMKVPRDCEVDIHMERDHRWDDLVIGDPSPIHREVRMGYIFDDKGKPVAGASIETKGDEENKFGKATSISDGSFVLRSTDFVELTISVEGHEPIKFDLKALKEKGESMLVKHDGLFIIIDFNW